MPAFTDHLRLLVFTFVMTALPVFAAVELHLSPAGNDLNPGTPAQPVATPQRALELARAHMEAGLTEPG
jgi:hypothetical protein